MRKELLNAKDELQQELDLLVNADFTEELEAIMEKAKADLQAKADLAIADKEQELKAVDRLLERYPAVEEVAEEVTTVAVASEVAVTEEVEE